MDSSYVPIYKQAAAMQHQFHDYSHQTAHSPAAMVLRNEIHQLTNDLATNKNPRTVEHRIKTIQNQMRMAQTMHSGTGMGQSPVLNFHQQALMHKNISSIQKSIRMNPHY